MTDARLITAIPAPTCHPDAIEGPLHVYAHAFPGMWVITFGEERPDTGGPDRVAWCDVCGAFWEGDYWIFPKAFDGPKGTP